VKEEANAATARGISGVGAYGGAVVPGPPHAGLGGPNTHRGGSSGRFSPLSLRFSIENAKTAPFSCILMRMKEKPDQRPTGGMGMVDDPMVACSVDSQL
jgi:hypothetical protein